jgi:cytidine deaminase
MIDKIRLIDSAISAQKKALCPYSNYQVGASLLADNNEIIIGFNIESKAYPTTLCAERVAIFSALTQGYRSFKAISVVTSDGVAPCGSCRQIIAEYAGDIPIIIAKPNKEYTETTTFKLLPHPFI